jgi:hypothetical protein
MLNKRLLAALFGAVVLAASPTTAVAAQHSVQDDQEFVYRQHGNTDADLELLKQYGIDTIRINVLHLQGVGPFPGAWTPQSGGGPWSLSTHADMPAYDLAVDTIQAHGLRVQLTLLWYGQDNPDALRSWMQSVAVHFAGRVQIFSILNEPDQTMPAGDNCDPRTIRQMIRQGTLNIRRVRAYKYKHLKRRQMKHFRGWRFRRIRRFTSTGRPKFVYRRSRKGHYRRRRVWKKVAVAGVMTRALDSISVTGGCERIRQGQQYAQVVREVAPAIRAVVPAGTLVYAGETSPNSGCLLFIGAATKGGLPVDGWVHHPYDGNECGIYNEAAVVAVLNGIPLGYSEFGYQLRWPDRINALHRAWQQAVADGVFMMNQYGLYTPLNKPPGGGGWDTSLSGDLSLLGMILQP